MNKSVRHRGFWLRVGLIVSAGVIGATGLPVAAQQAPDLYTSMVFREIGPTAQGNRFVDFAVVENTPRIFYAASATGGVYKTEDNGLHFTIAFQNEPVASVGAVAVAQSNPNVVYVGTGEGNNSRSTYWGNGVYVSTDAGATWTHAGLDNTQHIGRIVVDPTDPNTAYVAALGHLYSDNEERGLYKTTDGGKSWSKSLAVTSNGKAVGVVDVAMDPKNPNVLYAAAYDKVRRPWTFAEGGPGSGLYKTTNAGKSWTKLGGGLPLGLLGRIGVSVSRQDPNTVYAIIENVGMLNAEQTRRYAEGFGAPSGSPTQLWRSDDAGKTWRQVAPAPAPPAPAGGGGAGGRGGRGGRGGFDGGNPGYYYSQVRVDPNDKEHVFVLSTRASQSRDGGKTWQAVGAGGDNHALWIDPKDSNHILLGYDHGISITFDGGRDWYHPQNIPGAQFYAVDYDMQTPYNVYGGLQDNGSHKGPSTMPGGAPIPFEAWSTVGGGDGQYNVVDWKTSRYLYNEFQFSQGFQRVDQETGQSTSLDYQRDNSGQPIRYNWTAPILVSPHDPNTIYHAGNIVRRSTNRGDTWEDISPDLTVNDPAKQGGSGNITYATITTLDESPIVPGLLWAGTDDGNVQVTRDGGKTWTNVRDKIPGDPGYWVSRVEASHAAAGTAYVSVTGLRRDDFRALLWKTTDFGATWTSIVGNLPQQAINVVREDPYNANLLFVGTDLGVYATLDGGHVWTRLTGKAAQPAGGGRGFGGFGGGRGGGRGSATSANGVMPTNPVLDLKIQPRDHELIVATHGLGIFIADISAYEQLTPAVLASDAHLFAVTPVIQWRSGQRGASSSLNFAGMSRPQAARIRYYLKNDVSGDVTIRVFDGSRQIAEMAGAKTAGVNSVDWNLMASRERIEGEPEPARGGRGGRGGFGGRGRGGAQQNPNVVMTPVGPGQYRVVLSVGGREYTQNVVVRSDPR